jgi:hypothetical protein
LNSQFASHPDKGYGVKGYSFAIFLRIKAAVFAGNFVSGIKPGNGAGR